MSSFNVGISSRALQERALCRRYAAVTFSTVRLQLRRAVTGTPPPICWALGHLIDGQTEILGVWLNTDHGCQVPQSAFGAMYQRGAEFVRFGVGDLTGAESAFKQTYRHGQIVGSIEQAFESVIAAVAARDRVAVTRDLRASVDALDVEGLRTELARLQASSLGKRYPAVVQLLGELLARCEQLRGLHPELRELVRSADRKAAEVREQLKRSFLRHGPFVTPAAWVEFVVAALERADQRLGRDRAAAQVSQDADPATARVLIPPLGGGAQLTARA